MTRYEAIKNLTVEDMEAWLSHGTYYVNAFSRDHLTTCREYKGRCDCQECFKQYLLKEVGKSE